MKSQDRYFIGPGLRDKLRDMVRAHDSSFLGDGGAEIPTRLQDMPRRPMEAVRLGLIESSWLKGTSADVVLLAGEGIAVTPRSTFEAMNYFVDLSVDCGNKKVACARVGETWILIAAEC